MQTLDVISVNIWQILISLINLLLLFLIMKKFLFKPVKKVLDARQKELSEQYDAASEAKLRAEEDRKSWEEKLQRADARADEIMQKATESAKARGDKMIAQAQERADGIVRAAEKEAQLELKKAEDGIKREIATVSGALAEKLLEREINTEDHRSLIDSFIEEIGESDD